MSDDGKSIDGIISERDLAYGLAAHGSKLPGIAVSELMTKAVIVCSPEDSVTDVMKLMTERRTRHLPVKDGDRLVGIISIGDVLKHRLGEMQLEANVLRDYAIAARISCHHLHFSSPQSILCRWQAVKEVPSTHLVTPLPQRP